MTPFSINGKVIYIDILKVLEMSDEEFAEEYKDLIAADLGEEIENPFAFPPKSSKDDEDDEIVEDYQEVRQYIKDKLS